MFEISCKGDSYGLARVEGVNVQKIIEPKLLGMYDNKQVYLMYGKFGYYLRHDSRNYSLPQFCLGKDCTLHNAIKTIEYKSKIPKPMPEHLKNLYTYQNAFDDSP